jgi:hypothetical protein
MNKIGMCVVGSACVATSECSRGGGTGGGGQDWDSDWQVTCSSARPLLISFVFRLLLISGPNYFEHEMYICFGFF